MDEERISFSINNLIHIVLGNENINLHTEYDKSSNDVEERENERALKDADDLVNLIIQKSKDDEIIFKVNLDRKKFCWNIYKVTFDHFERTLYLTLGGIHEKPASLTHLNLIDATPFYKEKIDEILKAPREAFEALKKKRNDRATVIQALFRGYHVRKGPLLLKAVQKTAIEKMIVEIKELALSNRLLGIYSQIEKLDKEDKFTDLNINDLSKDLEQVKQSNDLKVVKSFLNKVINLEFNEVMPEPKMVKPIRMRMG